MVRIVYLDNGIKELIGLYDEIIYKICDRKILSINKI
jgi:hypothetical protein